MPQVLPSVLRHSHQILLHFSSVSSWKVVQLSLKSRVIPRFLCYLQSRFHLSNGRIMSEIYVFWWMVKSKFSDDLCLDFQQSPSSVKIRDSLYKVRDCPSMLFPYNDICIVLGREVSLLHLCICLGRKAQMGLWEKLGSVVGFVLLTVIWKKTFRIRINYRVEMRRIGIRNVREIIPS